MILVNAVAEDTMPVPGFERQSFRCSQCQDVEERLVFAKRDRKRGTVPVPEPTLPSLAPAAPAADEAAPASAPVSHAVESPQTVPIEPAQTAVAEPRPITPAQTRLPLETTQTAPAEPVIEDRPSLRSQPTVWTKALEKLNTFKQRAVETEQRAQFNRVWDSFRSEPPSSDS